MIEALGQQLRDICLRLIGKELFVVTVYDQDGIHHEYIIDEVADRSDRIAMDAIHNPVLNIHRTLEFISQLNRIGGDHEGSIHFYEYVTYLHFPAEDCQGVIISIDPRSDCYGAVYAECRDHVATSCGAGEDSTINPN